MPSFMTTISYIYPLQNPPRAPADPRAPSLLQRFIDFGSACDVASWKGRRGYSARHTPCAVLYCPPEQKLDLRYPFAYDIYSVALVWLRTLVPVRNCISYLSIYMDMCVCVCR